MYSKQIQDVLRKKKISVRDRITIVKDGQSFSGVLMPKSEVEDPNAVVIKADNGYNLGIEYGKGTLIEKSSKAVPKGVKEEEDFELGRIRKSLTKVSFDKSKPSISMIATGGTIASRVDYRTGGVYMLMEPEEFLHNIPELAGIVNFRKIENPFNKASEDMDHSNWQDMAKLAAKLLNSGDRGVILTHGTDTLHYSSAALSFMLRGLNSPVVLVGAQKSSDRGSADTAMNLICASRAALSGIAEVGICMHANMSDDYCNFIRGTKARKMHTSRRDAFRPVNEKPLAKVWPDGKIEVLNANYRKRPGEGAKTAGKEAGKGADKVVADTKFEPKVALLKAYPGSEPKIIDYLLSEGYKGIVIEGTGLGHVPTFAKKSWLPQVRRCAKEGIPVVVAPQTLYGRINNHVYTNLIKLYHDSGAIPGEDMLPETAYVKLCWVLGHTKDPEEVRKMMLTNFAGEITKGTDPDAFLY